jgi:hypothetical protein
MADPFFKQNREMSILAYGSVRYSLQQLRVTVAATSAAASTDLVLKKMNLSE